MSWTFYADGIPLHDYTDNPRRIYDPSLELALNKAGSFSFTVYPTHPCYEQIKKLQTDIQVWDSGGKLAFSGRVLNDTVGWHNQRVIMCEGELAYLNDSIQRPFTFPLNPDAATPADYLAFLLERHNAQVPLSRQFKLGNVTVTDPNNYIARSDTEYSTTWKLVNEGLLDTLGGYLVPRHEEDGVYLDYLSEINILATQPVQFGRNLLDLFTDRPGEDIATCIIPLGSKQEASEERLTIAGLPDEDSDDVCKTGDFVFSREVEALYGRISKVVLYDDVTIADNLLAKAKKDLAAARQMPSTVTLKAADLSAAGYEVNTFRLGTCVKLEDAPHSKAHALEPSYLVQSLNIKPFSPGQNTLTLGSTVYSFTEQNRRQQQEQAKRIENNVLSRQQQALKELELRTQSEILQSADEIRAYVSSGYYTKDDTEAMVSQLSTEISQTAEGIDIRFTQVNKDITAVQQGADAQFSAIQSYVRLVDGNIIVGIEGNPITLKVENDRIGIYNNGAVVTYWALSDMISPSKLRVPLGGQLQLGNFAFIPRSNGGLSFNLVG